MARTEETFSTFFQLQKSQHELDFVDVPISRGDIPLFIDPYSIALKTDPWSIEAHNKVVRFFQGVVNAIRENNTTRAMDALKDLKEPNLTRLGFSSGATPRGRGVSGETAHDLYDSLANSTAVRTGFLTDLEDCELLIPGIGRDKISDITTNVIKRELIIYTQEQCHLHNIPTHRVAAGRFWIEDTNKWAPDYAELPVCGNFAVILVPKRIVRRKLLLESTEYYNHFVLNFLQEQELRAGSSLVRTLKTGEIRPPTKKDMKTKYPKTKDFLFDFSSKNPQIVKRYKAAKAATDTPISNEQIVELRDINPQPFNPESLKSGLRAIPVGTANATAYHNYIIGVLTDVFSPSLSSPKKEQDIHQGRKRIDIQFTNTARDGFFELLVRIKQVKAPYVFIECKNYSGDPKNPELDQLSGRFSPQRGRFGFLVCRKILDKELFTQRCRDTALDDRGYIISLDDDDLCQLIDLRAAGNEAEIDKFLDERFQKLVC